MNASANTGAAGSFSAEDLARRIRIARGREPGDLCLTGGRIVNVFTQTVERGDVVLCDGFIAGVGEHEWEARETIAIQGAYVIPGLIDAHMHLESTLLMPERFARLVVPHGTAAVIADPHEIGNVLGTGGIELLLHASENLPLDCYMMAPSCVPASPWERAGATLDAAAIASLLRHPRMLGLAEMMNFPGVIEGDEEVLRKIAAALNAGTAVDGHCPGLLDRELVAYAAAGVRSDHECTTVEEAVQRAALGMLVQVREGSMARNLDTFLPLIVEGRLGDWALCTDDIHPEDLIEHGHIDGLLKRVVGAGVPAATAVRHATLVPARHYSLRDAGAVAPGYRADLAVMNDLVDFSANLMIKRGRIVARDGQYLAETASPDVPEENTVRLGVLSEGDFELHAGDRPCDVIGIVPDQIVTTHERVNVRSKNRRWVFDPARDVALIACIHRHAPTGERGLGLVGGFGFKTHGAIGSTVAHDAHNLIIAGTNARDMLACARALTEVGGGFAVVRDGSVTARLPLPVAGLLSTRPAEEVCRLQLEVNRAAEALGCPLHSPFGTLSFLGLSVIPELRITDGGLLAVSEQRILEPAAT